jgi:lysozyme
MTSCAKFATQPSPLPYDDGAGYLTIGFGHKILPGEKFDEPLLGEAAENLLRKDLEPKVQAANKAVRVPLYQWQWDSIFSLSFNIGTGNFAKSTLLRKVNLQEHKQVPAQFLRWKYAGGQVMRGLVWRREVEAGLYAWDAPY